MQWRPTPEEMAALGFALSAQHPTWVVYERPGLHGPNSWEIVQVNTCSGFVFSILLEHGPGYRCERARQVASLDDLVAAMDGMKWRKEVACV